MAYYDERPTALQAVGNGSYLYRYDIIEESVEREVSNPDYDPEAELAEDEEPQPETIKTHVPTYHCSEVVVWPPLTSAKITKAVINESISVDDELKIVNEYNMVALGMIPAPASGDTSDLPQVKAYMRYLSERQRLKAVVDADCEIYGIK